MRATALPLLALCFANAGSGPESGYADPRRPGDARPSIEQDDGPRLRFTINDGWRYHDGPLDGADAVDHPDDEWARVDLPHTWNDTDAYSEADDYRRGTGWYRRRLDLGDALTTRRLVLFFEGANQVADVWVNGELAGRHVGGYTAFAFDITDLVRPGSNVLAVRVDNSHDSDIPPLNADYTFFGGIYRDVWLIAAGPVHIALLDHGSPGIRIDTPEIDAERATVRIRGTVDNRGSAAVTATIESRVLDPAGRQVASTETVVDVSPDSGAGFEQSALVEAPVLWSPAEPNVHRVVTDVRVGGRLVDRVSNPLGFRWAAVDGARGFMLNGEPLDLVGTNRHQDRGHRGNALPDALHRDDVRIVKETGFNFLRLAHYPQDPAVLDAMDRSGLIGWEEIPVVNLIGQTSAFADNAERMLIEMIRQHYNHPSILFWGLTNEVLLRLPDPLPADYRSRVAALVERLDSVAREEDGSRLTALAVSFDEIDDASRVQDVTDVLGLNLYFGWYYRELDGLGAYLDSLHARDPSRPLLISEYGAGSDERIHSREPVAFDFSTEHQQRFHESHLRQLLERDYLVGTAVWNQFDFASRGRHDSRPNVNQKGLLRLDRTARDVWHLYRASLIDDEPVLHIATRDWPLRAGSLPDDARHEIAVYGNVATASLALNGEPLGSRPLDEGVARWSLALRHGDNRLVAAAAWNGQQIADAFTVRYEDRSALFSAASGVRRRDLSATLSPPDPVRMIAVNAGGSYQYVDGEGTAWEADRRYRPGEWGHVGGTAQLGHHRVRGTDEEGLFQARREGASAYRFDLADGDYEVLVRIVEMTHDSAGRRIQNVRVNGQPMFDGLDPAARYGRYRAIDRTIATTASGGSGVTIELDAVAGSTTISAIRIVAR